MANNKPKLDNAQDLPYNFQAEQACLGSALLSADALFNVFSFLVEDDFFDPRHKLIYRAMENLNTKCFVKLQPIACIKFWVSGDTSRASNSKTIL